MLDLKWCEFDDYGFEDDYVCFVYFKKWKIVIFSLVIVDNLG